eukprot:NODE_396_length_878_cov_489.824234_g388_i0.p1 GENE.NODE_396_length_878_cov_489.824234_g388_i0~~NODE_396_length_878_cov_489.824234_g388_i0.p1  ORF type:complete len:230 (-),score=79.77 NODE_396_length_878_cov_489.824234_g388_i0:188-817(-)
MPATTPTAATGTDNGTQHQQCIEEKQSLLKQIEQLEERLRERDDGWKQEKQELLKQHEHERNEWELSRKETEGSFVQERKEWERSRQEERMAWMREHDEERKMWRSSIDSDRIELQKQRDLWLTECRAREAECEKFAAERSQWESERKQWRDLSSSILEERETWRQERKTYIRQLQANEALLEQVTSVVGSKFTLPGEVPRSPSLVDRG